MQIGPRELPDSFDDLPRFELCGGMATVLSMLPIDQLEDGNADVLVSLDSGENYVGTFYTVENAQYLLEKFRQESENDDSAYMYDTSEVIVKEISIPVLTKVINAMIKDKSLSHALEQSSGFGSRVGRFEDEET